jgi:histidine triad (HIT) family protein
MTECLFCRIIRKELPSRPVYEDDRVYAFEDIHPQAPVHILVIPKEHIPSLAESPAGSEDLLGRLLTAARDIARERDISGSGYRLVLNTGGDSGQAVDHIHVHLLGGRRMSWPPG